MNITLDTVKTAGLNLLNRGEITQSEFDGIEKNAGIMNLFTKAKPITPMSKVTKALSGLRDVALVSGALAAVGGLAAEGINGVREKVEIGQSFDQLKKATPLLSEYKDKDIKDYFNVVSKFSPLSASNPHVAGSLVHKMLQFGGIDHKLVQDINKIERSPDNSFVRDYGKESAKALFKGIK